MKSLVVYGKGINYFFAKDGNIFEKEQLIRECDTFEKAEEMAEHLNRVLYGERLNFNGYSVVYGKGADNFFVINGDKTNKYEVLIESFETEKQAESKASDLNKINRRSDYH